MKKENSWAGGRLGGKDQCAPTSVYMKYMEFAHFVYILKIGGKKKEKKEGRRDALGKGS